MALASGAACAIASACLIVPMYAFAGGRTLNVIGAVLLATLLLSELVLRRRASTSPRLRREVGF